VTAGPPLLPKLSPVRIASSFSRHFRLYQLAKDVMSKQLANSAKFSPRLSQEIHSPARV